MIKLKHPILQTHQNMHKNTKILGHLTKKVKLNNLDNLKQLKNYQYKQVTLKTTMNL